MPLPNTVVIAHGASEVILARTISEMMRVPVIVFSKKNGKETIALKHLPDVLSEYPFDSESSMHRAFPQLQYLKGKRIRMPELRIVPIVDVDADRRSLKSYLSGDMFRDCVFHDRIIPVVNDPNMEAVFEDLGFPPITDKVEFYSQLYKIDVNALYEGFKGSGRTNMELFMEQLRKHCPSCQRRRLPLLETNLDLPATLQWTRIGSIFKTETNAWSEIEIEGFRPPPFRKGRVPHQSSSRSARNNLVAEDVRRLELGGRRSLGDG